MATHSIFKIILLLKMSPWQNLKEKKARGKARLSGVKRDDRVGYLGHEISGLF